MKSHDMEEMKQDMFKTAHRDRSHNMQSARHVFQSGQGGGLTNATKHMANHRRSYD